MTEIADRMVDLQRKLIDARLERDEYRQELIGLLRDYPEGSDVGIRAARVLERWPVDA